MGHICPIGRSRVKCFNYKKFARPISPLNARCRTDKEFAQESYCNHRHKLSPLCRLNFPMAPGHLLDIMYFVFIEVVTKMQSMWTTTHGPPGVQLRRTEIDGLLSTPCLPKFRENVDNLTA